MPRAAREVHRTIQNHPRGTHASVARELGISSQQLSHRLANDYDFTLEEIGIVADFLRAPAGWPFISWGEGEERDEAYRNRNRR